MKIALQKGFHILVAVLIILSAAVNPVLAETEGAFAVTGYTSSLSQITKGSEVSFSIHLKHTSLLTIENQTADISRLVDSFSGGTIHYAVTSSKNEPLELDVSVSKLKYTGSGRSLKLMINAGGTYEQLDISVVECKEYEEPVYEPIVPNEPDPAPAPKVIISRSELTEPIKPGEAQTVTVNIQNTDTVVMKTPVISFTSSEGLYLSGNSSAVKLSDIPGGKTASVDIVLQGMDDINSVNQYLEVEVQFKYFNRVATVEGSSSGRINIPVRKSEEKPDPQPIPEPEIIIHRNEIKNPIKAGEMKSITVSVTNTSPTELKSPVIQFTPSEGLYLQETSSAVKLDNIPAGGTKSTSITVKALKTLSSEVQYLDAELRYQYFNQVTTVKGTSSGRITVPAEVKKGQIEEDTTIDSPVPNLIVTGFQYGGNSVAAGSEFGLQFQFYNTSSKLPVENVVVTLEGGDGFTIHGASNTVYFEKIGAGGIQSVSVPMKAMPDVKNGAKPVSISFKYEYVDNSKRIPISSETTITVPVYQPDRFEITYPELPVMVYAGDEISVMLNYVNKSRTEILNVEAWLEGEVDTYTPVQNLGNMEPGKSGTIAFAVTAWEPGDAEFTISVAYEDGNGQTQTREFPLTLTVEEMVMEDPGMYEPMPEPEPEPQTNWKLIGVLAVAAVLILAVLIRKKKKAAALKKETEMWSSWDDGGDTAEMTADTADKQEAGK